MLLSNTDVVLLMAKWAVACWEERENNEPA